MVFNNRYHLWDECSTVDNILMVLDHPRFQINETIRNVQIICFCSVFVNLLRLQLNQCKPKM